jgi:hypothetical protein
MVSLKPLPLPVHCLKCGGSDHSLALTSVIIAGIGVIIAALAFAVAAGALVYTRKQHDIAKREHDEFMDHCTG